MDNWPVLAGGFGTLGDKDPVKTVGSYWPYLSTVWDYVNRSMPFGEAQSLSADEVYAIVAYMLYSNDLVDEDFVLSDTNFAEFEMHNARGFVVDDRPETEYAPHQQQKRKPLFRRLWWMKPPLRQSWLPRVRKSFVNAKPAIKLDPKQKAAQARI